MIAVAEHHKVLHYRHLLAQQLTNSRQLLLQRSNIHSAIAWSWPLQCFHHVH
jgi:hypothetical protein